MASFISAKVTILVSFQRLPSNGMYSINRISIFFSFVKAANAGISSSFTPRITTQFTLVLSPCSSAELMDRSTLSWPWRRVISWNRRGSSVSRLIFTAFTPLSTSRSILDPWLSVIPLLVIASVFSPRERNLPISLMMCSKSGRTVGSPPVKRIFVTPASTNAPAIYR